ncbi:winged helix-turn-helix domain-containing protein [Actinoplanes couchii]|uniref:MarR family transcriptional regulator n=1 Tax=Actinoplanes couchii TaxID=403638 RepID=A0ABQ3XT38_9ACTN|nr:transcriptional regulator [Actinoplanes couchii]MDR6319947.1 DNA-binding MarR family transcriptional regulator [Actinoplanes couchii]GID61671.1 MarR family transcriptional regulator [Actinoplanes couchii]
MTSEDPAVIGGPQLEPLLLDPTRLSIMATLAAAEWAEFGFVRDTAGLSDSTLSKRVAQLGDAGFVEVRKGYVGKRPRTWLNLSEAGRAALRSHIAMLRKIAEQTA